LPLLGLAFFSRVLWTGILGILAGLGMACAKQIGNSGTQDDIQEVTCYKQVAYHSTLEGTRWENNLELDAWARAEHSILSLIRNKGTEKLEYNALMEQIDIAERAAVAAKAAVDRKELLPDAYFNAMKILNIWHRELAASSSNVLCYQEASYPPYIDDVNRKLQSLEKLSTEGKLNDDTMKQVREGIKESLVKEIKPEAAEELSLLLVSLLYN
jgi:hypothetical protein